MIDHHEEDEPFEQYDDPEENPDNNGPETAPEPPTATQQQLAHAQNELTARIQELQGQIITTVTMDPAQPGVEQTVEQLVGQVGLTPAQMMADTIQTFQSPYAQMAGRAGASEFQLKYPRLSLKISLANLKLWLDHQGNTTMQTMVETLTGLTITPEVKAKAPEEIMQWMEEQLTVVMPVPPPATPLEINAPVTATRVAFGRCNYREPEIARDHITISQEDVQDLLRDCDDADELEEKLNELINDKISNTEFEFENNGEVQYDDHDMEDSDEYEDYADNRSLIHRQVHDLARTLDPDRAEELGL